VANKDQAIIECKKVLWFFSQRFDNTFVHRPFCAKISPHIGFKQTGTETHVQITNDLPRYCSQGVLVISIRIRNMHTGQWPANRLDKAEGEFIAGLTIGVAKKSLYIH